MLAKPIKSFTEHVLESNSKGDPGMTSLEGEKDLHLLVLLGSLDDLLTTVDWFSKATELSE